MNQQRGWATTIWLLLTASLASGCVLVGLTLGVWWLMSTYVSAELARLWAMVVTALLPITGWLGYRLGQQEARGKVAGIDAGISQVMAAAGQTAALRVQVARALRQPGPPSPAVMVWSDEPVFHDPPALPTDREVVEL